ncbi:MAG: hypothetical protein AAB692_03630 [Patescibacteria group bacterium]
MPVVLRIFPYLLLARFGASGLDDMIASVAGPLHQGTGALWQQCLQERAMAYVVSAFLGWLLSRKLIRCCTVVVIAISAHAAWRFGADPHYALNVINLAYAYVLGVPVGELLSRKKAKIFGLAMDLPEDRRATP